MRKGSAGSSSLLRLVRKLHNPPILAQIGPKLLVNSFEKLDVALIAQICRKLPMAVQSCPNLPKVAHKFL